jgi:RimJ/RimL family protein N-acetyltransferase
MNMIEAAYFARPVTGIDMLANAGRHVWDAKDGTQVLFRPIEPEDVERERDFVHGLSPSTSYLRLMSARVPSDDEIYRWTHIDRQREGAVIATVSLGGREVQIGVARYVAESDDGNAEFAIVIGDAWHGKSLGLHLLSSLIDLARQSGVVRLFGTTLSENSAMLGLARRVGFKASLERGAAYVTELSLDLHSRN